MKMRCSPRNVRTILMTTRIARHSLSAPASQAKKQKLPSCRASTTQECVNQFVIKRLVSASTYFHAYNAFKQDDCVYWAVNQKFDEIYNRTFDPQFVCTLMKSDYIESCDIVTGPSNAHISTCLQRKSGDCQDLIEENCQFRNL